MRLGPPLTASTKSRSSRTNGSPCAWRIALRLADRAPLAPIDHQVELRQLDRESLAEELELDTMAPAEQASRGDRTDRATRETQRRGRDIENVGVRIVGPLGSRGSRGSRGHGGHVAHFPDQQAEQVEDMRCTLRPSRSFCVEHSNPPIKKLWNGDVGRFTGSAAAKFEPVAISSKLIQAPPGAVGRVHRLGQPHPQG